MRADGGCPELPDTEARLEYLRGGRSTLEPKCVVDAIRHIDGKRYPQAGALIRYLDFRDPSEVSRWKSIDARYPAVGALYLMGKAVVPELTAAIARPDTSGLVRENAAWAIVLMYGSRPEAIAVLVSAAHAGKDPSASERLMEMARGFAARCPVTVRNDCENAVPK